MFGSYSYSQWTAAGTPSIGPGYAIGGASCHSDGITWVGEVRVFMSLDSGLTWLERSPVPTQRLADIFFLDKLNGIIVPDNKTTDLLITNDQGITWRKVQCLTNSADLNAAAFIDSPNHIIVVEDGGNVLSSDDGGASWRKVQLDIAGFDVVSIGNGVAYVSCGSYVTKNAALYKTTDYGRTWSRSQGMFDWDSYQFVQDQCDPNVWYVANEDYAASKDGLSSIYVTTDNGVVWKKTDPYPIIYHCGSITTSKNAVFGQTALGVIRSTDKGLSWMKIGGPDHRIDTRLVCAITNNIIIAVDTLGKIWRTSNSGGFPIPDATTDELTWFPTTGFAIDTLSFCDSARLDTIILCSTCDQTKITDFHIAGADSADYSIISFSPQTSAHCDTLIVSFKPSHIGPTDAKFTVTLDNANQYSILFQGVGVIPRTEITLDPVVLFVGDTVSICDTSLTQSLSISSFSPCGALKVVRTSLQGAYSGDYILENAPLSSLLLRDSLSVTFTPKGNGTRNAEIVIELEDGTLITIPLVGVGIVPKAKIQFSGAPLFSADTICLSDSASQMLQFSIEYCRPLKVLGQVLQGNNSSDYTIKQWLPDSLGTNGVLEVTFVPKGQGLRYAELILSFEDGSVYTIPLKGIALPISNVSLSVGNVANDTLGGFVSIPLYFKGLVASEDVSFSIIHDRSLEFVGVYSPSDIPIGQETHTEDWVHIAIPAANVLLNAPSGYVAFRVYSDSGSTHTVKFDSLSVLSIKTTCLNIEQSALATVTSLGGCGSKTLSKFLRTGKLSSFTLVPNPAHTELHLVPTASVKNAGIEIFNVLGDAVYSTKADFEAGSKQALNISSLSEGMYYLRIITGDSVFQTSFAVKR